MLAQTLGGIGLFLLGMILMTDGLRAMAGDALRTVLARATRGRASALAVGAGVTALVQSSSATTLMTIGFVSAGLLTFTESVGVIIGANIGTTSTGWIVSVLGLKVKLGMAAMPAVALGALLRLLGRDRAASLGMAIAGFGLIFIGIDLLQEGMTGIAERFDPSTFPGADLPGRFLLVAIGIVMTVVMQSSSAAIATVITALFAGTIQFEQAAAVTIGANIGTTVTAALGSIGGTRSAKRTALAHIVFNLVTGAVVFTLMNPIAAVCAWAMSGIERAPGPMSLALFHTATKSIGAMIFVPMLDRYSALIERLLPDRGPNLTRHLDARVAETGPVAVEAARRTVIETMRVVVDALRAFIDNGNAAALARELETAVHAVDQTRRFLARVNTTSEGQRTQHRHLSVLHAMDHLDRLVDAAREITSARTVAQTPDLRGLSTEMRDELDAVSAWLNDPAQVAPVGQLEAMSRSIAEFRRTHREKILEDTARGKISPETADRQLEACRWVDRLGYHLWRAVLHLQEDPSADPATAVTEVHADPHSPARDG